MYRGCANFGLWALTAAAKKLEREASGGDHHHHHHHHRHHHSQSLAPSETADSTQSSEGSQSEPPAPMGKSSLVALHPFLQSIDANLANAETHSLSSDSESDSDSESSCSSDETDDEDGPSPPTPVVKVTGHIPAFHQSMIRERVSPTGQIRPLEPASSLAACTMSPSSIGELHALPVRKWLAKKHKYDLKYAKDLSTNRSIRLADRAKAETSGYLLGEFQGERPPLASLAAWSDQALAIEAGESVDETGGKVNMALAMWSRVSAAPDEEVAGAKKVEAVKEKMDGLEVGGKDSKAVPEAKKSS
jgi:hypothetical protein